VLDEGVSYKTRLEGALARAKTPARRAEIEAELFGPPFPHALGHLWRLFGRLSERRASNGFGPSPISYLEISAFCELTRLKLDSFELEILEDLDSLFLSAKATK